MKLNKHYSELNESYLFSTIAHKVAAYQKANPDKDIIRLGIGDVTLPLAKSVTDAMLKAVEEQGKKETFHGYIPSEQGYDGMRQLWAQTMYDAVYKTGDTPVAGDLNQDGACTVADVVLLQKWLMGAGTLTNWQAAELTGDGVIDSADLCILRRMLTNQ